MLLYLDIETLPTNDESIIESLAENIRHPATHKKQETIDAWYAENKESALRELVSKTSFDGLYGSIACMCWAFDDGEVQHTSTVDMTESQMLEEFYSAISNFGKIEFHGGSTEQPVTVVGHNVAGFDLPFLKHRSIILGVKPTASIRKAMSAKPWDSCIADTMLMWNTERDKRVSMDKLCKAFGIEGKGDMDGSMVAETWKTDKQKVIQYCEDDVHRTRQIYKRITFS